MMLLIAIPLLFSIRLPLQQKAVLLIVFGMGAFVIVAAILTKIYCLVPSLITYVYLNWYVREASVSVYVTNLPALWSLLRDMFPQLRSWGFESKKSSSSGKTLTSSKRNSRNRTSTMNFNMQSFSRLGDKYGDVDGSINQSQEQINKTVEDTPHYASAHRTLAIQRDVTFTVEKQSMDDDLECGNSEYFVTQQRGETQCTSTR